jgi:hypothetical protein
MAFLLISMKPRRPKIGYAAVNPIWRRHRECALTYLYFVREGNRAGEVVGRVRALIKKAPARKDAVEINDAIVEVIALTRAEAADNNVSVRTQLAEGLPHIRGEAPNGESPRRQSDALVKFDQVAWWAFDGDRRGVSFLASRPQMLPCGGEVNCAYQYIDV